MLLSRGNVPEAFAEIEKILKRYPSHAPALVIKSKILSHQYQPLEARTAARAAIDSDPNWVDGYKQLAALLLEHGKKLLQEGDAEGAYESFRQILLIDLDVKVQSPQLLSRVHDGIAQALHAAGMTDVAIENLHKAISLHSKNADALFRLSKLLLSTGAEESTTIEAMRSALAQRFDVFTWAHVLRWQHRRCDWSTRHNDLQRLSALMGQVSPHSPCPLPPALTLDFPLSFSVVRACAASVSAAAGRKFAVAPNQSTADAAWDGFEADDRRVAIAILSGSRLTARDETARLLQAVPVAISRTRFRVLCFEIDSDASEAEGGEEDQVRARIAGGCDELRVISSDGTLPPSSIHISLSLFGHDSPAGLRLLASHTAQLQVSWQGYPSTVGAAFVPLLSADCISTPPEYAELYSEKLLLGRASALVSSHSSSPVETVPVWAGQGSESAAVLVTRQTFRLPSGSFVFAYFGDLGAIDPQLWMAWMEILRVVKRSCLWLLRRPLDAERHLHEHGIEYGIHSSRIIFSDPFPPHAEEAAMALADLFLDTQQRTATPHTIFTALHAALPVLTLPGDALHRRLTASILLGTTGELALVARNLHDYEEIAMRLASNPSRYRTLREKLSNTQDGAWNVSTKVRAMESQWRMAWDVRCTSDGNRHFNLVTATV